MAWTSPDPLREDSETRSIYITELQDFVNLKRDEIGQSSLTFINQNVGEPFKLSAIEELKSSVDTLAEDFGYIGGVTNSELLGRDYVNITILHGNRVTHYPIINDLRQVLNLIVSSVGEYRFAPLVLGNFFKNGVRRGGNIFEYSGSDSDSLKMNYLIDNDYIGMGHGTMLSLENVGGDGYSTVVSSNDGTNARIIDIHGFSNANRDGFHIGYEIDTSAMFSKSIGDKNFVYVMTLKNQISRFKIRDDDGNFLVKEITDGSVIGNMTLGSGLTAAINNIDNQPIDDCAQIISDSGYIGRNWGNSPDEWKTVTYAVLNTSDFGIALGVQEITLKLQASTDNFSSSIIELGEMVLTSDPVESNVTIAVTNNSENKDFRYHRVLIEVPLSTTLIVSELRFFGLGGELEEDSSLDIGFTYLRPRHNIGFGDDNIVFIAQAFDKIYLFGMTKENGDGPTGGQLGSNDPDYELPIYKITVIQKGELTGTPGVFTPMSIVSVTTINADPFGFINSDISTAESFQNIRTSYFGDVSSNYLRMGSDGDYLYLTNQSTTNISAVKQTDLSGTPVNDIPVSEYDGIIQTPATCGPHPDAPCENLDPTLRPDCCFDEWTQVTEVYYIGALNPPVGSPARFHRREIATPIYISGFDPYYDGKDGAENELEVLWEFDDSGIETLDILHRRIGMIKIPLNSLSSMSIVRNSNGYSPGVIRLVMPCSNARAIAVQGDYVYLSDTVKLGLLSDTWDEISLAVIDKATGSIVEEILEYDMSNNDNIPDGESEPFEDTLRSFLKTYEQALHCSPDGIPDIFSVTSPNVGTISVAWSTVSGADSYNVWKKVGNSFTFLKNSSSTSTLVGGLPAGNTLIVVNAVAKHGDGINSDAENVTVL